jgi:hypothetical protein
MAMPKPSSHERTYVDRIARMKTLRFLFINLLALLESQAEGPALLP